MRHLVEIGGEASGIDRDPEPALVREAADQVAPAQRDRVEREPPRSAVHEPLDQVIGFGLASAAIGVDRQRVREHAAHRHEHCRNFVHPAHCAGGRIGRAAGTIRRKVGPKIGYRLDIEREKATIAVQRQPPACVVVAALRRAHELLAALGDPFHRPAQPPRRPQHQHPFGIEEILDAKPTADIGRAHSDAFRRDVEHRIRKLSAKAVHPLSAQQQVEALRGGIVGADCGARLYRRGDQSVVDEINLD